jgi:putative FmdB family regulatory protein
MPVYEFRCEECGAEFEELVKAPSTRAACPSCGSGHVRRLFSAQAAPFHLVKSRGHTRTQEARNAKLRETTKANFKAARRRAREGRSSSGGGRS